VEQTLTITNKYGLHARAAMVFVDVAKRFESEMVVIKDSLEVNGKSIIDMMLLAAEKGSQIKVRASGVDAAKAIEAISELVAQKFYEE